jgi:hypothetical protein
MSYKSIVIMGYFYAVVMIVIVWLCYKNGLR